MSRAVRRVCIAALAGAAWVACDAIQSRPFIAGQYIPALDCVTPGEAIDILNGAPNDADCDATCIVPNYEAGVFVTGACPPFPPGDFVNPDNPLCVKALAAIHRSDLCLDSGPSNPAMDAAKDAGDDAAKDAPGLDAAGPADAGSRGDAHAG